MKYGLPATFEVRKGAVLRALAGPAIITICSVFAAFAGDAGRRVLRLERSAVIDGELWRLVTGHVVHLSIGHLLLNLAGLAVIVFVLRPVTVTTRWWCGVALTSAAAIDAGLFWVRPELAWYVGLSGVLHGFWAAAAVDLSFGRERLYGIAIAALLLAKLVTEKLAGAAAISVTLTGGPVVTDAHLFGAIGGAMAAAVVLAARRRDAQQPRSSL